MYISRVQLDVQRRNTLRALSSPQILHGAVETSMGYGSSSNTERRRVLWRVDYVGDKCYLLLVGEHQPDLRVLHEQFGHSDSFHLGDSKPYTALLDRLQAGQRWQFRLRANPVKSSSKEANTRTGRGKLYAHVTKEQQLGWLKSRADDTGFHVQDGEFEVIHTEWKKFHKGLRGNHEVSIRTATYEGLLTITDEHTFRQMLVSGMGRAKAYGCGLMTIMRPAGYPR